MDVLIGIAAFILIIGVIVLVHEGGHYLFAKKAGILAREFAFGMGPQLWKKKKGETVYSIRAFPIGGFCAIAGEETEEDPLKDHPSVKLDIRNGIVHGIYFNTEDSEIHYPLYEVMTYDLYDEKQTGNLFMTVRSGSEILNLKVDPQAMLYFKKAEYQIAPYNRTLGSKTKRARAMVMFGGPLMNILLALLAFFFAGLISGFPNEQSSRISGLEVSEDSTPSPAYTAGLRNGDVIVSLKSGNIENEVSVWKDISDFMTLYTETGKTEKIEVTYNRAGNEYKTEFLPQISFYSIAAIGQVDYQNDLPAGIRVIAKAEGNDGNINNTELEKNDLIVRVDGKSIAELDEIYTVFQTYTGEANDAIAMTVLRNGIEKVISVKPYNKELMDYQMKTNGIPVLKVMMGVSPSSRFSLPESVTYGFERTYTSGTAVFKTLGMLFRRTIGITSLTSFIGIGGITVEIAKGGIANLLNWLGLLSVNIGIMNLLPIPALDGGRLVFLGYEAVTGKKPNPKVETGLITVTMLLLFGLMIFISIKDVINFFK